MSWAPKPLREILAQSGRDRAGDRDLPVLSITMRHGLVDQSDKFKKRIASSDTSNYRIAYKDELVVGFPIDEGVLGFQTKYPAGIVSPAYDVWKLQSEADCHIPYLERYLRSSQARSSYASRMQGAVARRRSLTKTDFLNLEIPFPPIDDQVRIAHLLSKVEGLIGQRQQHLQQLDDLLRSAFLEMFGDPVRNDKLWPTRTLGSFVDQSRGISYGIVQRGEFFPGGVPVLRIRDVISEEYDVENLVRTDPSNSEKYARTILQGGELLLSIRGTVGAVSVAPPHSVGWNVSREIAIIPVIHGINIRYLVHLLKSPPMQRLFSSLIKGVAQSGLNLSDIRRISVIVPPSELQSSYEQVATKIESLIRIYKKSFGDLAALYGSLSQLAFKGELDLVRVKLPEALEPKLNEISSTHLLPLEAATITLPETDLLLVALNDAEKLEPLLGFWLMSYAEQIGNRAFSVDEFMRAAELHAEKAFPDREIELGADAYDLIKAWVFDALSTGRLEQVYPSTDIRVALRKPRTVAQGRTR